MVELWGMRSTPLLPSLLGPPDVPYSQLTLDTPWAKRVKWTYNVHKNLEIRKHVTTCSSGTKPFY